MKEFDYYTGAIRKYFVFSGRASRAEYWYFILFDFLIGIAIRIADFFVTQSLYNKPLSNIYLLALLIPSIALLVRRLHDTGKTGWLVLLLLIPVVNLFAAVVLFVFTLMDSGPRKNQYGPKPKGLR